MPLAFLHFTVCSSVMFIFSFSTVVQAPSPGKQAKSVFLPKKNRTVNENKAALTCKYSPSGIWWAQMGTGHDGS